MATQEQTIESLVDALSALSVLDMSKLKSALEDKWGVKAASAAPVMMAAAPSAAAAPAAESTEFKVTLDSVPDDKKIGVIKAVREITGLGLKEAKDMVDGAPKVLKETCPKAEAEEIVKKITAAGGKATSVGL
ncbi:MAG: 50S ribosomal protein L7/L12 [Verrucomicrobia bacterium]|nr:50S ribosomal protein L7/L12 [Verrucomicrobiota bacterium]